MISAPRSYHQIPDAERASILVDLRSLAKERGIWFRGATVITMDPELGDFVSGDVLVHGSRVIAIGADLASNPRVSGAVVVDCAGMILCPGLVDAHRHCWQTAFRRMIADADLDEYVATTHGGMALHYAPIDMHVGTLASTWSALDSGITTVLDFSHNSRSVEHSDAVIEAYRASGIRAVHASAAPNAGTWQEQWPADLERLLALSGVGGDEDLISLRMGLDIKRVQPVEMLLSYARDLGVQITFDGVLGPRASQEIEMLADTGLLGPDITLIHCTDVAPRLWSVFHDWGVRVTLATSSDEHIGIAHGVPPIQTATDHHVSLSLSTDVEVTLAGDMFTQMRATLMTQRMHVAQRRFAGDDDPPRMLTNREALTMATVNGADHVGLGRGVGRIAVGFQADFLLIRGDDIATMPLNNAVGTIVQGVDASQIDSVFVGGQVRKWNRQLVGVEPDAIRSALYASRDRIAEMVGWELDPIAPPKFARTSDVGLSAHVTGSQISPRHDTV